MTSTSKNLDIDKLGDIVIKYNNTYRITIKMNPVNVKSSTYNTDFKKGNNKEDPKFETDYYVRISKYKNILAKGYAPNSSEKVFVIKKLVENTMPGQMLLVILMVEKLLERFINKNCKKQSKRSLELKKYKR